MEGVPNSPMAPSLLNEGVGMGASSPTPVIIPPSFQVRLISLHSRWHVAAHRASSGSIDRLYHQPPCRGAIPPTLPVQSQLALEENLW